ncbi:hypothetical protein [Natrinema salaciae]|uniref:DUF8156 domain-containing protein n=1 Tax=Natrinema salaciae TaxID=1186196 RepID=A0A1H9RLA2_9EURY|nr:hypothetical protein [Natrinema salaciae]SER73552.1 hypothetical protein SAMN04489841_4451 [Natrinema salaciae]
MGRTNPTYRDALRRLESEWEPMRRALRRAHQDDFDRLFDRARSFADAAGYANQPDPERALLLSLLLAHEVELRRLREERAAREIDDVTAVSDGRPRPSDGGDHGSAGGEEDHAR